MPTSTNPVDPEIQSLEHIAVRARSNYRTLEEMVVSALREAILSGVFAPGERLHQDRIATTLGVSRIPIRSAFRQLESEGLVVFQPHRGTTVGTLRPEEVAEIYDLRIMLEKHALRSACARVGPEEIAELEALSQMVDETRATGRPEAWLAARRRFYSRLYEIANLPRTAALIERLRGEVGRYLHRHRVDDERGHRVIVDSIKSGNPLQAENWLEHHLTEVSKRVQKTVEEQGTSG